MELTGMNGAPADSVPTPVLLIGASGMLGRAWSQLLSVRDIEFTAPPREELDLAKPRTIGRFLDQRFATVINCAAWTDVDGAEANHATADLVNGHGVTELAGRCAQLGTLLIHYSTDYIFDGTSTHPRAVEEPTLPINAYGRSKLIGDLSVRQAGGNYLLIRTSLLYAPWGENFVRTMAKLVRERPNIKVVNDQRSCPTSCEHLASITLRLLGKGVSGVYHVTDGGDCTRHALACEIARTVNPACSVEPCSSEEFPRPAPRPRYSVLDTSRAESLLGPMSPWETNLSDVLDRLEHPL